MHTLTINKQTVLPKEYQGQRVVTFADIDQVHERVSGTARKRLNDNKKRFIEGVDYFKITPSEFRTRFDSGLSKQSTEEITLLTESGYLMLVKSFTDDLAWKVQRELVNTYFRAGTVHYTPPKVPTRAITAATAKIYKGRSVLTLRDLSALTGIEPHTFSYHIRHRKGYFVEGVDYWILSEVDLIQFKAENKLSQNMAKSLTLVTREGLRKLSGIMQSVPPDAVEWVKDAPKTAVLPAPQSAAAPNMLCDVPDNRAAQSIMQEMHGIVTTVGVLLNEYNAHRTEAERKGFAKVLLDVCGRLYIKSSELDHVKYKLVEKKS